MKFRLYPLLAVALCTFFVSTDAAAIIWDSAEINNLYAGQTATQIVFRFKTPHALADDDTLTIAATGSVTNAIFATGTGVTSTCVVTIGGSAANSEKCDFDATNTLKITADGAIAAGNIVVTLTSNIAANNAATNKVTFIVTPAIASTEDEAANAAGTGFTTVKSPAIYYLKSECRVGGLAGGALAKCNEADCETCTGKNGFVVKSGLQEDTTKCAIALSNDEFRCDSLYHTDSSLDVAVKTYGLFGTLTCGAFDQNTAPATTYGVNLMNLVDANLFAANSVFVHKNDRYSDHVVTLFNLPSNDRLDIVCHMENVEMSPKLTVWTDKNDRIYEDSLVPGSTTIGDSPATITLTFTHGLQLASGKKIYLKVWSGNLAGTSATVFEQNNVDCTATSSDKTANEDYQLTITGSTATAYVTSTKTLTITIGEVSVAGNTLAITCNSQLKINPSGTSPADIISYDLTVEDHPVTLQKRYGWKTTAAP